MQRIIFFLSIVALSWACESPLSQTQQAQVNQIDTLLYVSDSLYKAMDQVNDSLLAKDLPVVEDLYKTIAQANPDSADKRFWVQEVNRLELIYSSYNKFLRDKDAIKEKLALSTKQLETLRNSVVDGKLDSAQIADYLEDEAQALAEVHLKFNKRQPGVVVAQGLWDTTRVHFENMAQQIQSKKR